MAKFQVIPDPSGSASVSKSLANLSLARLGLVDQKSRETGLVS